MYWVFVSACQDTIVTEFPPGLEPLEANTAPLTDTLTFTEGTEGFTWVHGRVRLPAPADVVWSLAKDAERMVARCDVDQYELMTTVLPDYEYSFDVHYTVHNVLTVTWDEQWRFGWIDHGDGLGMIRYQKVLGSDFIRLLEGSIQVVPTVDGAATDLQFVAHLDALGGAASDMKSTMRDRAATLSAALVGGALPPCQ